MENKSINLSVAISEKRNSIVHNLSALSVKLSAVVGEGVSLSVAMDSFSDEKSAVNAMIAELNDLMVQEYVGKSTFADLVKEERIPCVSLSCDEGAFSLSDSDCKVTIHMLKDYLPAYTAEKVEAIGRITAMLAAYDMPELYKNPAMFIAPKLTKKGALSNHEKKVQEFIKSMANSLGGYSVKMMKQVLHDTFVEVSEGTINENVTSAMYRDYMAMSIARGKDWGKRDIQSCSVYGDMFLEYVHMILTGKTFSETENK